MRVVALAGEAVDLRLPSVGSIIERRLESDGRICAAMDVRPIALDRLHLVTSGEDRARNRRLDERARGPSRPRPRDARAH